jgi:heme/copper-type cytochrome/quinol oxidase subunit 3
LNTTANNPALIAGGGSPGPATPSTNDTLSTSKLGIYFFLAAEAMFFVGLLGSFVVLGSAGEQHEIFSISSKILSVWIGVGSALLLLVCSAAMGARKWWAVGAGGLFVLLQLIQWKLLWPGHGPWDNNFFACYFLVSAVVGLHLLVAIAMAAWSAICAGKLPGVVQIYWHFGNAVGVLSLFVLYFV